MVGDSGGQCTPFNLTGKLFGKGKAAKNTTNKEFYFLASILMVWSQNWPRLFVDIFSLKLQRIRYQKNQISIFEDFLQIKTWQKYASKWFPLKFITVRFILRTATFFKASIKYRSNVTQALFWDLESRINSLRTMKKKAKNIDRSIQNGAISICKMTTLLRVTFQACKSSTVLRQHHMHLKVAHVVLFLDRVTTGHPRLMEMPADHFSGDPFPILFVRLPVKGF